MAFDKEELKQLNSLLNDRFEGQNALLNDRLEGQRSLIMSDTRSLLEEQLKPIKAEIEYLKQRLDRLFDMVNEDIRTALTEIEDVKKRVAKLEHQVATLEH